MYRILALDGGGMKGIFTTTLLERLVEKVPSLVDNVDLIAGTSTGGIVALGLAAGRTPQQLTGFYRDEGPRIFEDSFWDNLIDLGTAVGADYGNKRLKRALRKHLGKDTRLTDLDKRVLIPSFDLDSPASGDRPRTWKPKFFHNYPGRDSDGKQLAVDVALRTSAAPTYFPSYQGHIDGGVVANNPSMAAIAQALDRRGGKQKSPDSIMLLSLGTGAEPKHIKGNKDWGWGQWARPLISVMVSGTMGVADYQCRQLLGATYRRLNRTLEHGVAIDDASTENLDYLVSAASGVRLTSTVHWLKKHGW